MKNLIFLVCLTVFMAVNKPSSAQWQQLNFPSNMALDRAAFPTAQVGFVANSLSTNLWRTQDGGVTWDSITFTNNVHDVDFINADTGFVLYGSSSVYKLSTTYNGGDTWSDQTMPSPGFSYYQMVYFINVTTGFVNTYDATILQTTDGGANWNTLPLGSYGYMADKDHINEDTLVLAGADGTFAYRGAVYRSDDGGNNWTSILNDSSYTTYTGSHFLNGSLGFVVYDYGWNPGVSTLAKTNDGGSTWSDFYTDTTLVFQDVYMNSVVGGYIAGADVSGSGTGGKILKTNNGISWQIDFTTPYPVRKFYKGGNALYGIGDGGIVVKNSNPTGMEELYKDECYVYPNPSNGIIRFSIQEKSIIGIYNMTGALIKSFVIQPGETIDLSALTEGLYFAELSSENYSGKTKILIVK